MGSAGQNPPSLLFPPVPHPKSYGGRVATVGQNLSNLFFTVVALTFIAVEGGPLMLAAWLKKAQIKEWEEKGISEGRAAERDLIFEAFRNRQPGETDEDVMARLEKERDKSANSKG